ncbi:MAG: bifunctional glutamate N-acetyltransferase/amino-acid acetyltransferase ArgJ [Candidatus Margulisiibacteriota bacterium]
MKINRIEGGICAPEGFLAAGFAAGIKKSNKKDLALIYAKELCSAAAVFTTNRFKAAPVLVSMQNIKKGVAQAIIINSGNANACTGKQGLKDAWDMASKTAASLSISKDHVLVASTGIIGRPLPAKKILGGIWAVSRMIKRAGCGDAAEAILTTDTRKKEIALEVNLDKKNSFKIAGIAKGSGMICPDMASAERSRSATMIAVITTDADIDSKMLNTALKEASAESFNMITVDNDMSTNDTVFCLASKITAKIKKGKTYEIFYEALKQVCVYLAKEIVKDGEGATKIFEVLVKGAKTFEDAKKIAKAVAGSSLFKCAVFGSDPNWGRIAAAAGCAGVEFDPDKTDVFIEKMRMVKRGSPVAFDAAKAKNLMEQKEMRFTIDLNSGTICASAFGCDMTKGYIDINARYHT